MKKIRFLFDGNFEIGKHVSAFHAGDIVDAPDNDADELITGLCAELVGAVKIPIELGNDPQRIENGKIKQRIKSRAEAE